MKAGNRNDARRRQVKLCAPRRRQPRAPEGELLAMLRVRLLALGVPAEHLSEDDLRRGVRHVVRALDDGTLALNDLVQFCADGRA